MSFIFRIIVACSFCFLPLTSFLAKLANRHLSNHGNDLLNNYKSSNRVSSKYLTENQLDPVIPEISIDTLKYQILQFGAILDRGQAYNPTSGSFYADRMTFAKKKIEDLIARHPSSLPTNLSAVEGEWELILTTVPHGIFRSSPFFQAIQEAYATAGELDKANLFFKLHELQTCSWGISKIGRVAQRFDAEKGLLYSEFDTALLSLTTVPIIGWGKLFPTFGGCVVTVSKATMSPSEPGVLNLEVDYTTAKPVDGLNGLGEFIWGKKVPVGSVWKFLPWNKGRSASCKLNFRYCDDEMRIMEDIDGEYFVYVRPVCPRN